MHWQLRPEFSFQRPLLPLLYQHLRMIAMTTLESGIKAPHSAIYTQKQSAEAKQLVDQLSVIIKEGEGQQELQMHDMSSYLGT